jgi:hypothetical protein
MVRQTLPKFDMDSCETGCCPRFDPSAWDGEEFEFPDRLFLRAKTVSFLHVPLNIGSVFKRTMTQIQEADAAASDEYLILSTDTSPWRGEHYFSVTKEISGGDMATVPGRFLAKVFEGPYHNAGRWVKEMAGYVESQGKEMQKLYFFYTTCPKCAKHYGKNYVVAFAQV